MVIAHYVSIKILMVITFLLWVDVDDQAALKKAKNTLVRQLYKTTDGPISRNVNRRFSNENWKKAKSN